MLFHMSYSIDCYAASERLNELVGSRTKNISAWDGHFYAKRAIQKLGLEKRGGVTRLGISIYNTSTEVKKTIEILFKHAKI